MAPRKKNPAIKSSGSTSSKASPLPDWVKGGGPKPPPSYTKAGREAQAAASASASASASAPSGPSTAPSSANANASASVNKTDQPRELLFPPGSKTPLNMMYERIQKQPGWEKPLVEPHRFGKGFTCTITLRKVNKKDASNPFTIAMQPKEPPLRLECESPLAAKHWAATYVLFRLYNNLNLYRALPPGPREYWLKCEEYKKTAPDHQDWMWQPDPFDAKAKRDAEKERKEIERAAPPKVQPPKLSKFWAQASEIRMASALRERVEATIRTMMSVFPDTAAAPIQLDEDDGNELDDDEQPQSGTSSPAPPASDDQPKSKHVHPSSSASSSSSASQLDIASLERQLTGLGFRPGHARSAASWLSKARTVLKAGASSSAANGRVDPLLASAANLNDRDAALEYLLLYTPEEDLPVRYRPTLASENFITSASSAGGSDALAQSWAVDRLVKYAGFPRKAVQRVFTTISADESRRGTQLARQVKEGVALEMLLRQLPGWEEEWTAASVLEYAFESPADDEDRDAKRADERAAVEAVLGPECIRPVPDNERSQSGEYDIAINTSGKGGTKEDVRLRVKTHARLAYPSERAGALPAVFVASSTLPSYLKLALTRHLLAFLRSDEADLIAAGEGGVLLSLVAELEAVWRKTVDDPPLLGTVMEHIVPQTAVSRPDTPAGSGASTPTNTSGAKQDGGPRPRALKRNAKLDASLLADQKALRDSKAYASINDVRRSLPAHAAAESVLSLIRSNRVVIVAGETGCGKTTQVPQFILDDAIARGAGSECSIVVTQPRRVSAMGVASRVAFERCEEPGAAGALTGYAIRGERRAGRDTRLLFTTTGTLLRRLAVGGDPDLVGVSHILVDEVHERSVDSDFLLLELREVLRRNRHLRVVLMSATIDQHRFAEYFGGAPCVEIPGRTFPVTDVYLEDLVRATHFRPRGGAQLRRLGDDEFASIQSAGLDEADRRAVEVLARSERVDYDLLHAAVAHVLSLGAGAVLVFLPGVGEIRRAIERLSALASVDLLPLHANLSSSEQRAVFRPARSGRRKVVVATNVAETSITIPDVAYVIDSGRVKETRFDAGMGITRLEETWASQAACRQRRGRAGRVGPGTCVKLFTRFRAAAAPVSPRAEMQRVPLDALVLSVKARAGSQGGGGVVDAGAYLAKALDPPALQALEAAHTSLRELGALGRGGEVTGLGRNLALLPTDLRLGKLLVLARLFGALDPALTLAAVLSNRPVFRPGERPADTARLGSDLLLDMQAYLDGGADRALSRDIASTRADLASYFPPAPTPTPGAALPIPLLRGLLTACLWPSLLRVSPSGVFHPSLGRTTLRGSTVAPLNKYIASFQLGRDATNAPAWALLLLCGALARAPHGVVVRDTRNRTIAAFRAPPRVAVLAAQLRAILDKVLEEEASVDGHKEGARNEVADVVVELVSGDGAAQIE